MAFAEKARPHDGADGEAGRRRHFHLAVADWSNAACDSQKLPRRAVADVVGARPPLPLVKRHVLHEAEDLGVSPANADALTLHRHAPRHDRRERVVQVVQDTDGGRDAPKAWAERVRPLDDHSAHELRLVVGDIDGRHVVVEHHPENLRAALREQLRRQGGDFFACVLVEVHVDAKYHDYGNAEEDEERCDVGVLDFAKITNTLVAGLENSPIFHQHCGEVPRPRWGRGRRPASGGGASRAMAAYSAGDVNIGGAKDVVRGKQHGDHAHGDGAARGNRGTAR
mmetsp:Transcript_8412/g.21539  ORF Transcript_8412/g.21539 Transcript_8412/m.21539 type:complete len:282 (+) Transcript_8412:460-1305(+)